jgi:hypothetical protein
LIIWLPISPAHIAAHNARARVAVHEEMAPSVRGANI